MAIEMAPIEDGVFHRVLGESARAVEEAVIAHETIGETSLERVVERFTDLLQLNRGVVLELLGVSRSRLSRNPAMSVELLDRAGSMLKMYARVATILGSDAAPGWFARPNPHLGYATPLNLLDTSLGRERLNDVLTALEDGVFL